MSEFKISNAQSFKPIEFKSQASELKNEKAFSGESFGNIVENVLNSIEETQVKSDAAVVDLATGKNKNIHEVMMTMEKADTALKLGMQIRNKIIDAYKEIMRMQV